MRELVHRPRSSPVNWGHGRRSAGTSFATCKYFNCAWRNTTNPAAAGAARGRAFERSSSAIYTPELPAAGAFSELGVEDSVLREWVKTGIQICLLHLFASNDLQIISFGCRLNMCEYEYGWICRPRRIVGSRVSIPQF